MKACIICESIVDVKHFCTLDGFEHLRCNRCGLIFVNKPASTEVLYKSYSGSPFKSFRRKLVAPFRPFSHYRNFKKSQSRGRIMVKFVSTHAKYTSQQIKFLDIGCNRGFLLAAAIENNWDIYGVEIVPELMAPFKNKFKSFSDHIYSGRFADIQGELPDNMFNAITAIDVIEHFEDPVEDIRNVYRILKPGGIFVIQTPDSLSEKAKTMECNWPELKPLEHLFIFNPENLEKLSIKTGFNELQTCNPFEIAEGNFAAVLNKSSR